VNQGRLSELWAPQFRALTVGLILTITFVASESLAVITVMPLVARDLDGLRLYGWALSGFMLSSVIGTVAAGRGTDRHGPAAPFLVGLMIFMSGLAIAGLAPSMGVFIAGRALQGLAAGVVPSVAYATIGRRLPPSLRPRMIAVISTAWIAPGLAGPAISAEVAHAFGWRWVFLGLLPLVAAAGSIAIPALARTGRPGAITSDSHNIVDAIRTATGSGLILAGLTLGFGADAALPGGGLVLAGVAVALPALRRLVPAGTLTARAGLPATILSRGLLTFAFFGADSYVTLSITAVRHGSVLLAGFAVTGATVAWTCGSWIQAQVSDTWEGRRLIRTGLAIIVAGIAGMVLVLYSGVPAAAAVAAWTVAGLGMGMAYSPILLLVLRQAPAGREGRESASLNLADLLGTAIGIGVGGAAVAAGAGANFRLGITAAFGIAAGAAVLALATTWRLPTGTTSGGQPPA
jgi:MFS family permease